MATCPHCESDVTDWAERLERDPGSNDPTARTCPECDTVLGVTDYGG